MLIDNKGIETEVKTWSTTELKLLSNKMEFIKRKEGPASLRRLNRKGEVTTYTGSASVDLETAPFEYLKQRGFNEMKESYPNINKIEAVRVVTANTEHIGTTDVEFQGEVLFNPRKPGGGEMKVKLKMFTTSCSVQVQKMRHQGEKDSSAPAIEFAEMIVENGKTISLNGNESW